jgi:hypothetical protein
MRSLLDAVKTTAASVGETIDDTGSPSGTFIINGSGDNTILTGADPVGDLDKFFVLISGYLVRIYNLTHVIYFLVKSFCCVING